MNIPLIILGSARRDSNTRRFVEQVMGTNAYKLVNLLDELIGPYSYAQEYSADDTFLKLADLMQHHEVLILATPVYWYSMSGRMKIFFDRLTDLITVHKKTGRQLAGKNVFLLVVGSDLELPEGFEVPFHKTCNYLDMRYVSSIYHSNNQPFPSEKARSFMQQILSGTHPN